MSRYPEIRAGQRILADTLNDMIWDVVAKSVTEQVTNSTTLQDDDELFLEVEASAAYDVELALFHSSGTTGDFKCGWTGPTGATFAWGIQGVATSSISSAAATEVNMQIRTISEAAALGGANLSGTYALIKGTLITSSTAGLLQFQFAQNVSDAAATQVRNGSTLKIRRTA